MMDGKKGVDQKGNQNFIRTGGAWRVPHEVKAWLDRMTKGEKDPTVELRQRGTRWEWVRKK
jgi:hypothetical protein